VICFAVVEEALAELDRVIARGARCVLVRPAPVPGYRGTRSPGLPEFDPVGQRIVDADLLAGMHSSDSGYADLVNWWQRSSEFLPFRPDAFAMIAHGKRAIEDTMTALVCHGALSRFPTLKIAAVENGANWVGHLLHEFAAAYKKMPHAFAEDPVVAFKRNVYVNPFWEDDIGSLVDLIGADHILFGSDYPHPEGMVDPISYVSDLAALPDQDQARIMGGNLARLMNIGS
jgi:predicted TIM-barrel fold metal-dependent hydrolase